MDQAFHLLLLQVQNAKQMNSGLKHALEASLEEFRLPEVGSPSAVCFRGSGSPASLGIGVRGQANLLLVQSALSPPTLQEWLGLDVK